MNHLYEDKQGVLHSCESGYAGVDHRSALLVWTKCEKDVPANKSFTTNYEVATCQKCIND